MFGKKKQEEKTIKKVSKTGKKKVSKKKVVGSKKGTLNVGGKYFNSPDEVSAYYRSEGERVKKALKAFKIEQAASYLGLEKGNLMKFLSQKKKLDEIAKDLDEHKNVLNSKISDLNAAKEKSKIHKRKVQDFVRKLNALEVEAKKILDVKDKLIQKEGELIAEMKKMSKFAQRDLDLTDVKTANKLSEFEASKEEVLVRARDLLSEEISSLFADKTLLENLDEKAIAKIKDLNNQLAQIQGAKKETLKKRNILELSEKETESKLAQAEAKVKKLEEKYRSLLKK